jgi:23S rRNA-/tRNA-specific pseudouridylate synthase
MAKKNKKEPKISKKEIAMAVYTRLEAALSDYQKEIGEKKFISHLKKAAKGLAEELAEISKKQKEKLEKESKRVVQKKKAKTKKKKLVKKQALKNAKAKKDPIVGSEPPERVIEQSGPISSGQ